MHPSRNHSLRILNFDQQVCNVILKNGFNKSFIENEINIRNTFNHSTIPRLLETNLKKHYYVEELIQGVPINRLHDFSEKIFCFQKSKECLLELYDKSRQMNNLQEWLVHLCNKLKDFENFLSDHVSVQLWSEINEVSLDLCQIIEKEERL